MWWAKQFLEWYLGVPASGPGEGTAWRFECRSIGPEGWPAFLVLGLVVVVVLLATALSLYESRRLPWWQRGSMLGLRLASLGLVAVMLSQLTVAVDRTGLPVLGLLIDDSASMRFAGLAPDSQDSTSTSGNQTRLEDVQKLLARDQGRFLKQLAQRFRVRIYRFDKDAVRLPQDQAAGIGDEAPGLLPEIEKLTAGGLETRPAQAVRTVLADLRGLSPAGIVIFTDGISTTGPRDALSSVASLAGRRGVPLYPVGVGKGAPRRDVDLFELVSDEVGFWGDPVGVSVRLRTFGLEGETVTVTLTNTQSNRELARATTTAKADGRTSQLEFTFIPKQEGEIAFVARAKVSPPESNQQNNLQSGHVYVRKEKLRVLLADHAPRYEFRFLKSLLAREPTIALDTVLQEADLGYARQDETGLERFPLRAERIFEYDVIIFGDLDPSLLGNDVLAALAEFVREKGGGFIGIAGPRFFPMDYGGTPLEQVLPIEPEEVTTPPADLVLDHEFHPRLTLQAERSGPMFRFDVDPRRSDQIWRSLPGFYWHASAGTLQPGAVPLATIVGTGGRTQPVFLLQRFGAGWTLLHLTDETWRWRFRVGNAYFGRYWIQSIRYLSSLGMGAADEGSTGIVLSTDRQQYSQGEPVTLRARTREGSSVEADALTILVEDQSSMRREVTLRRVGPLSSVFEGSLVQLAEGNYHAWVQTPTIAKAPAATDFKVTASGQELAVRTPDLDDLRRAAKQSGGRFWTLKEASVLPKRLPAGRPVLLAASSPLPLWNRPELLIALVGMLACQWWLRKRGRLA